MSDLNVSFKKLRLGEDTGSRDVSKVSSGVSDVSRNGAADDTCGVAIKGAITTYNVLDKVDASFVPNANVVEKQEETKQSSSDVLVSGGKKEAIKSNARCSSNSKTDAHSSIRASPAAAISCISIEKIGH